MRIIWKHLAGIGFSLLFCQSTLCAQTETPAAPATEFRGMRLEPSEWMAGDTTTSYACLQAILTNCRNANFNALIFKIRKNGEVYYPSQIETTAAIISCDPEYDRIAMAIQSAHAQGLKAYLSLELFNLSPSEASGSTLTARAGLFDAHGPEAAVSWVCQEKNGLPVCERSGRRKTYFLSPGIPEVQAYLRSLIKECVRKYECDGLLLEQVTYPHAQIGFDPVSRERFFGRGNPECKIREDWLRTQLSKFVNDTYAEVKFEKSNLEVGVAAFFTPTGNGYSAHFQSTWQWLRNRSVDFMVMQINPALLLQNHGFAALLERYYDGYQPTRMVLDLEYTPEWETLFRRLKEIQANGYAGCLMGNYPLVEKSAAWIRLQNRVYIKPADLPDWNQGWAEKKIILGKVTGQGDQPLTDAWVSVGQTTDEEAETAYPASADGVFSLSHLPPGPFNLKTEYAGVTQGTTVMEVKTGVAHCTIALEGVMPEKKIAMVAIIEPRSGVVTDKENIHLLGRTRPDNRVAVAGTTVVVYATGLFACDSIPLVAGENTIAVQAWDPAGNTVNEHVVVIRRELVPEPMARLRFLEPTEDQAYQNSDIIQIKAKAPANWNGRCSLWNHRVEFQLTEAESDSVNSVYTGSFRVPENFSASAEPVVLQFSEKGGFGLFGKRMEAASLFKLEVMDMSHPRIAETKSSRVPIHFSTYRERLGGPYVAEVAQGTRFQIIGRLGKRLKVELCPSLSAWVNATDVRILPEGATIPQVSITSAIVDGDTAVDKILIPLGAPVMVAVSPLVNPGNALVIDIFNAQYAATWFIHRMGAKVVGPLEGVQMADNWVRLTAPIRSKQLWGYWTERNYSYKGKKFDLAILVKRPPRFGRGNPLEGFRVGLEAGHGGYKSGAIGITGSVEKIVNQQVVSRLRSILHEQGARVTLLRMGDSATGLFERIATAHRARVSWVLSLHANWQDNTQGFLYPAGACTFYKYDHCQRLAEGIQRELQAAGAEDYGVIGNFNYLPLRDTQIPGILIEQGFLSNPSDEAKLLDPQYQQKEAEAIARGLEKFLRDVRE